MNTAKVLIVLFALICIAMSAAGCSSSKAPAETPPAAPAATGAGGAAATAAPSAATTQCPDKEVLTGSWDSREVGYASNHDVREQGVWADAGPVPVTLTQKCWDTTGTFKTGDCQGTLTGKLEKNVFTGQWSIVCTNSGDSGAGTFSATMAADNQSFMGAMYRNCPGCYGPDAGFPPSWWAKKLP